MLNAAIVGCGVIAPTHAKALEMDGRVRIRWACDVDNAQVSRVAAEHATSQFADILNDQSVQLVHICTPHQTHAELVIAALAAGKHVVCEKALATTPADVSRMVAAAAAQPRLVASGIFQHRFSPLARRLVELVRGGDFGRLERIAVEFRCTRTSAYYASGPWRGRWLGEGGGLMINQAIHTLDSALGFLGAPVSVAGTVSRTRVPDIEVEDGATFQVTNADGAVLSMVAENDLVTGWENRIVVTASGGSFTLGTDEHLIALDHPSTVLNTELWALEKLDLGAVQMPGKACYGDHHALQIQDCVSAVLAGRAPRIDFASAAVPNRVVLGLYQSAASGGATVALSELDTHAFNRPSLPFRKAGNQQ
jgi:UDP-N-acetyl-2-amino-2-deoxyglucuronate dehydrogenase